MASKFCLIPNNWEYLKEILVEPFTSLEEVYEILNISSGKGNLDFKGVEQIEMNDKLEIFNFVRIQALQLEDLFPEASLLYLEAGKDMALSLKRKQILVILCHMTLLTLKTTSKHVYWITFENWLTDGRPCATAYLYGLFSYFSRARELVHTDWAEEIVTFERKTYSNPTCTLSEVSLKNIELHLSGSIGDFSCNVVDFANEHIGFGISGTQEEIIFGSFIEMCPAMIFCCEAMRDDEAICIKNVLKYATYCGYGFDLKFSKSDNYMHRKPFNIVAIDAMDFSGDYHQALRLQLDPSNINRELRKLITGFSFFAHETIDTGHWGCGAYGGNKCIKAILQLIAASVTNNTLSFCCFGDEFFFNSFNRFLQQIPPSIPKIIQILSNIDCTNITNFTFEDFIEAMNRSIEN